MRLAGIGIAVGTGIALAIAPLFAHHLTAVDPFEPVAYGGAIALVALAGGAGWCRGLLLPARRAVSLDPVTTLRCD